MKKLFVFIVFLVIGASVTVAVMYKKMPKVFQNRLQAGVTAVSAQLHEDDKEYKSRLRVDNLTVELSTRRKHIFRLEVAETPADLEVGLMFRKKMGPDSGMIFLLGTEPHTTRFWMKNTLIPLDMLFVAKDGTIVNICRNAQPESLSGISSVHPVSAVIEINGGRADEVGIRIGDKVSYPYFQK